MFALRKLRLTHYAVARSSKGITGTLPEVGLAGLPALRELYLHALALTGTLPGKGLSCMSAMYNFHLMGSRGLIGALPAEGLGGMSGSVDFLIAWTSLSGALPEDGLQKWTSMRKLQVYTNHLAGTLPDAGFKAMSELDHFVCGKNKLAGALPTEGFKGLVCIGTAGNAMRGTLPEEGAMIIIDVCGNLFTGSIPPVVLRSTMFSFEIAMNRFTGTLSAEAVRRMVRLEIFNLAFNQLAGSFPSMWPRPPLEHFVLSNNRFSGMLTEEGANFHPKNLDKWMVNTNSFSGTLPDAILSALRLQYFLVQDNLFQGPSHVLGPQKQPKK